MKTLMSAIALTLVITAPSYAQVIYGDWHGFAGSLESIGGTWSQSGNNLALAWKRQGGR